MTRLQSFRGIRYDRELSSHLREWTRPAGPDLQGSDLPERHVARLRSSRLLTQWQKERVLRPESAPMIYLVQQEFLLLEQSLTRFGWLGAVEPGELTAVQRPDPREAEAHYRHLKSTGLYLENLLAVCRDRRDSLQALAAGVATAPPDLEMEDEERTWHRIWLVSDAEIQRQVQDCLAEETLALACGHELHEAARRYASEQKPGPARRCPVVVCPSRDPGLVVLPVHRGLRGLDPMQFQQLDEALEADAELEPWERSLPELLYHLWLHQGTSLGMARGARLYLLRHPQGDDRVFLEELLSRHLSAEQLRSPQILQAQSDPDAALERVQKGELQLAFFVNPVRIEELLEAADRGRMLPPASLAVHPAPRAGLVLYGVRSS
ncbi:MAG: DUF1015 family protein [Armatimonadetes bacterium]|nr:DUF1015 family protein [Armatimonadota bacterium]